MVAAYLLELLLQRINELVALDEFQLGTGPFGALLLKRSLEFLCVRRADLCEFELECLEIGSSGREFHPVLVSSGELDPDAFELLCTLVESRTKAGDRRVLLSGLAGDPRTIQIRTAGRHGAVELKGLRWNPDTLGRT